MTPSFRRTFRLLLANAALLLALLLGLEGLTRLFGLHQPALPADPLPYAASDETLGWTLRPNSAGADFRGGPQQGLVRTNSLGLRADRDYAQPKPPGVLRILLLGDSFAFGVGVDQESSFATLLEARLNRSGGPLRYEVANLGVSGYSTDQELLRLRALGERLQPDLVILMVCGNDFAENTQDFVYLMAYKPWFELSAAGRLVPHNQPVPTLGPLQRAKVWLGRRSNVWNFFRNRSSSVPAVQRALDIFSVAVAKEPAARDEQVRLARALVGAIHVESERLGARLLVTNTALHRDLLGLFEPLAQGLEADGLACMRLQEPLRQARKRRRQGLWSFPQDRHWNVDSHRCIAELLEAYVVERVEGRPAPPRAEGDHGCAATLALSLGAAPPEESTE